MSVSPQGSSLSLRYVSPVGYPPLLDVGTDIQEHWSRFDYLRSAAFFLDGTDLVVTYGSESRDTVAGACRKR